jgi:predicted transcriptional regulator
MSAVNRALLLNTLIKHETLTIADLAKEENIGLVPNKDHLKFLLDELSESGYVHMLDGVKPYTYTITDKGIREGARINADY